MGFYDDLDQILDLLRHRGRVTYRALKREFNLEDDYLEDLKDAILCAHPKVIEEQGWGIVWTGDPPSARESEVRFRERARARLHVVRSAVLGLLQREGRVTYRTLTEIFGCDAAFLEELKEELFFTHGVRDEQGKGLVWTGEAQPAVHPVVQAPGQQTLADTTAVPSTAATPSVTPRVSEPLAPSNGPTVITPEDTPTAPDTVPAASIGTSTLRGVAAILILSY